VRTGPRSDKRRLPSWAAVAIVAYLAVVAALIAVVLLTKAFGMDLGSGFRDNLLLAVVVLTLPVSAAYTVLGMFDSSRAPLPGEITFGVFVRFFYYLGYLLLAAINAAAFRWLVLTTRKDRPVQVGATPGALSQDSGVRMQGMNQNRRHLWWTVPLAVLLSLPQWLVAGFAWCGISGCSGGGFGVATGTEWVAVSLSCVNGLIFAVAVFAVPWLHPTRKRAVIAITAGALFGLIGAAVTHG
jgi:hypothetical protein